MDIQQVLQQSDAIGAISRELGIDQGTAKTGAAALLPEILAGFKQPVAAAEPQVASGAATESAGGFGNVLETISALGGGALLDSVTSNQPTEVDKGNQILGQIFGSKDGSRAIAAQAAAQSGVEPSVLKKMLPILAMVAAGYLARQGGREGAAPGGGGLGGMLGGIFGGQDTPSAGGAGSTAASSQSSDILGQLIGAAGKYFSR